MCANRHSSSSAMLVLLLVLLALLLLAAAKAVGEPLSAAVALLVLLLLLPAARRGAPSLQRHMRRSSRHVRTAWQLWLPLGAQQRHRAGSSIAAAAGNLNTPYPLGDQDSAALSALTDFLQAEQDQYHSCVGWQASCWQGSTHPTGSLPHTHQCKRQLGCFKQLYPHLLCYPHQIATRVRVTPSPHTYAHAHTDKLTKHPQHITAFDSQTLTSQHPAAAGRRRRVKGGYPFRPH